MRPPADQIPTTVAINKLLARSAEVAIALTAIDVHATGLTVRLALRLRTPPASIRRISQIVTGYVDPRGGDPDDRLVLTAAFADGRIAALGGGPTSPADPAVPPPYPAAATVPTT